MKPYQTLLEELFAADPSLREHAAEIEALLPTLLAAKPVPVLDEAFRISLKQRLMDSPIAQQPLPHGLFMRNAFIGVLALAVAGVSTITYLGTRSEREGTPVVTTLGKGAFGTLASSVGSAGMSETKATDMASPAIASSDGGAPSAGVTMSDERSSSSTSPALTGVYRFSIPEGGIPALPSDQLDVYKRVTDARIAEQLGIQMPLVNLKSFENAKLQNFTLNQKDGYTVTVDLDRGRISISDNVYRTMDSTMRNTVALTDDELKTIAKDFLSAHGVATGSYGEPVVQKSYDYAVAAEKQIAPEMAQSMIAFQVQTGTVLFPLLLNGKKVVGMGGETVGMTVSIDTHTKRVSSVYDIFTNHYESSAYDVEKSAEKIKEIAELGGMYNKYGAAGFTEGETKSLGLDTPELGYMLLSTYVEGKDIEYLVPAYIFAIKDAVVGSWQERVVVPLIPELIAEAGVGASAGGGGEIMPLDAVAPATAIPQQ
ncbi:MAG TPA: hypothetical protein VLA04_04720 [Verrucomicrobiae bacterium]|nr:hypothetical protein [Verrucomicrobiae bacterium]